MPKTNRTSRTKTPTATTTADHPSLMVRISRALFETSTNGREGEHHHGHKRKLSSDKQARDLSPKRACTSNAQEETGGEEVGGARGDKGRKKNASCVVESPKDDDIIVSEVELDKDTFQKVRRMVLSGV